MPAAPGDREPGELEDFRGEAIELVSRRVPLGTVLLLSPDLPPRRRGRVVAVRGGEGPGTRSEGFTIAAGEGTRIDGVRREVV